MSHRVAIEQGAVVDPAALRLLWTERQFQAEVELLAARHGWIAFHDRDPRMNRAGFPDLLLVRERLLWCELKTQSGRLRPAQKTFMAALKAAGQDVRTWRPVDWVEIEQVLA